MQTLLGISGDVFNFVPIVFERGIRGRGHGMASSEGHGQAGSTDLEENALREGVECESAQHLSEGLAHATHGRELGAAGGEGAHSGVDAADRHEVPHDVDPCPLSNPLCHGSALPTAILMSILGAVTSRGK